MRSIRVPCPFSDVEEGVLLVLSGISKILEDRSLPKPCGRSPTQVLLLERWMTMALAAHAADNSKTEGSITDKKQKHSADDDDLYLRDQSSPRVSSAAGIVRKKSRSLQEGTATRPRGLSPRTTGEVGSGSTAFDSTAAPCQGISTTPAAAATAATVGGKEGQERGSPEAGCGRQGVDANSGPAEEERKAAKIRAQMSVLMVGLFEIIRQVKARIAEVLLGGKGATPRRKFRGFSH